jgi:hypothetical protein
MTSRVERSDAMGQQTTEDGLHKIGDSRLPTARWGGRGFKPYRRQLWQTREGRRVIRQFEQALIWPHSADPPLRSSVTADPNRVAPLAAKASYRSSAEPSPPIPPGNPPGSVTLIGRRVTFDRAPTFDVSHG